MIDGDDETIREDRRKWIAEMHAPWEGCVDLPDAWDGTVRWIEISESTGMVLHEEKEVRRSTDEGDEYDWGKDTPISLRWILEHWPEKLADVGLRLAELGDFIQRARHYHALP